MADNNTPGHDMFKPARPRRIPRPAVWRVLWVHLWGGLVMLVISGVWFREAAASIGVATVLSVLSQSYYNWRSLRNYGAGHSALFVVGAAQGLFGKWIILASGLVGCWLAFPTLHAIALLLTVCVLNTLAALLTPVLVK